MDKRLIVSPSPHISSRGSTQRVMLDVLIALVPAFIVAVMVYGYDVFMVTGVCVAACVAFEYLIQRFMLGGRITITNLSAVLTGVLLAFNLPTTTPLWMVALGAFVAIGVGKMSFGGLGKNPFNPAMVGRVFLLLSFPVVMTSFPSPTPDALSGATPLAFIKESLGDGLKLSEIMAQIDYKDFLSGNIAGSLGETAAGALLLGFIYLLWRRVITWHIPVAMLGSMALFAAILWGIDPEHYVNPLFHILSGGAILGAVFMATDYVTSPMSKRGMILFGVGIGVITMCIRVWGAYPEGVSFAILIMNAVVPLINKYMPPKRFGGDKRGVLK